jgi:hypothetical protein
MILFIKSLLIVTALISTPISHNEDPAVGNLPSAKINIYEKAYRDDNQLPKSLAPPILDLTLTPSTGVVYVSFTASQPLYAGWVDTNFCSSYTNWDYWWLNTRLGIDDLDTVYVLVSLYNYSNNNENFQRDVLDYTGNVVYRDPEWNGYQAQPIVKDGFGNNHYIGQPVLGWFDNMDAGAVDNLNYIYSSKANNAHDVVFTKLDSVGNIIYDQIPVATGDTAQSWTGDSHLDINSLGDIYIAWSRNMHEIVYSKSTDGGATWSLPVTVAEDFANQVNKPEILISPDDHIHFIWQYWTGSHNCLVYKKLYPGDSCCVDTTNLTPNFYPEVWAPEFVMDSDTNIHIVWSPSYQGSNSLYYTLIDGKLDKAGQPATDSEITIIQEYAFYTNAEPKRYPKIALDSLDCPHIIFDQGAYGNGTTKTVYHTKKVFTPQGYVIYPDSSLHKLAIDTSGGYTSSFPAHLPGLYFVKVWGWNAAGEIGWDTASIYMPGVAEDHHETRLPVKVTLVPTITRNKITLTYSGTEHTTLELYDVSGMKIINGWALLKQIKNEKIIKFTDLTSGIYFFKIKCDTGQKIRKFIIID